MSFDEYETLPSSNVIDHMMAGAIAGIMEHCVMYPLDSVKVSVLINHIYIYLESLSLYDMYEMTKILLYIVSYNMSNKSL